MSQRPVPTPRAKPSRSWPESCLDQALGLQRLLAISDRDWHALKTQRSRRAAEQLAAALVLLISGDDPGAPQPSPARVQAIELVEHALRWLKAEVSDPGCPSHGPGTTTPPSDG